MPRSPTDDERKARLEEEHTRQHQSRSNSTAMNALLRGEGVKGDADAEPADFNASIRKAAGRPYKTKTKEQA